MGKIANKTIYLPETQTITTRKKELQQIEGKRGARNNSRRTQERFRSNLIEVIPKDHSKNSSLVVLSETYEEIKANIY